MYPRHFFLCLYTMPHFRVLIFLYILYFRKALFRRTCSTFFSTEPPKKKNLPIWHLNLHIQARFDSFLKLVIEHNDALSMLKKHKYWFQWIHWVRIFKFLLLKFFALLRVYNGHCFKVRAQVCKILLDFWSVTSLSLHFNGLVTWSLILHQYFNAHKLYVHRIFLLFFTVFLLKLQYEILDCQMKQGRRHERLLATDCNAFCEEKCALPYFQGLVCWWIDDPIKAGTQEQNCFALLVFMWNNGDLLQLRAALFRIVTQLMSKPRFTWVI